MGATLGTLKKIGKLVKDAWLIVGISILLFCLLELGLSLVFAAKDWFGGPKAGPLTPDSRVIADAYADASWVKHYYEEFWRSYTSQWHSYVYWRRTPYRGEQINNDSNGIRLTTLPGPKPPEARKTVKIFMFGGSAVWGTGARDAFTIPSLLAKELHHNGVASEVVNFGQAGYVSTQGVITLLLRLRANEIPDLVIFYDGVNDSFSAYQQQAAGHPQNESNRVREFNLSKPERWKQRRDMVLQDMTQNLSTMRLVRAVLKRAGGGSKTESAADLSGGEKPASDNESLVQGVVDAYKGNIELVKALSAQYRFKYLFYWQPTIFQKAHLTQYESAQRDEMRAVGQAFKPFVQKTYDVVQQSGLTEKDEYYFHDLSLAFADISEPIYLDWCHLGESGNEVIAKHMAKDVMAVLAAD